MKSLFAQSLILVVAATAAAGASGSENAVSSINLGIGGLNPMPHCNARVYTLEYERLVTPTVTVLGRGSGVNYHFDDGKYLEDGRLRGVDVGFRHYPSGGMQGFFWGASFGYWQGDWTYTQNQNRPDQWQGRATSWSSRLNLNIGDRIPIDGTSISIMPEINLGKFFSSTACEFTAPAFRIGTPCSQKSEVDSYLFAGVMVGVVF